MDILAGEVLVHIHLVFYVHGWYGEKMNNQDRRQTYPHTIAYSLAAVLDGHTARHQSFFCSYKYYHHISHETNRLWLTLHENLWQIQRLARLRWVQILKLSTCQAASERFGLHHSD